MRSQPAETQPYLRTQKSLSQKGPTTAMAINFRWMGLSREAQIKLWAFHDIWIRTSRVSRKGVHYICVDGTDFRMAMMEIRMAISALILNYESWSGVPDRPGHWDEEMKPYESIVLTPEKKKCVLKFKNRVWPWSHFESNDLYSHEDHNHVAIQYSIHCFFMNFTDMWEGYVLYNLSTL
jgi:hypothetical protein